MNTRNFLEQLAKEVHYSPHIKKLVSQQSEETREALASSSISLIHNQFSSVGYLANPTNVVELRDCQ